MNILWIIIFLLINIFFISYLLLNKQDIKKIIKIIIGNSLVLLLLVVLSINNFFNLNAFLQSVIMAFIFVTPFFYMDYNNSNTEKVLYVTQKVSVVLFIAYAFMLPKIYNYNNILCYLLLGIISWLFLISTITYIFIALKGLGKRIKAFFNKS